MSSTFQHIVHPDGGQTWYAGDRQSTRRGLNAVWVELMPSGRIGLRWSEDGRLFHDDDPKHTPADMPPMRSVTAREWDEMLDRSVAGVLKAAEEMAQHLNG